MVSCEIVIDLVGAPSRPSVQSHHDKNGSRDERDEDDGWPHSRPFPVPRAYMLGASRGGAIGANLLADAGA